MNKFTLYPEASTQDALIILIPFLIVLGFGVFTLVFAPILQRVKSKRRKLKEVIDKRRLK